MRYLLLGLSGVDTANLVSQLGPNVLPSATFLHASMTKQPYFITFSRPDHRPLSVCKRSDHPRGWLPAYLKHSANLSVGINRERPSIAVNFWFRPGILEKCRIDVGRNVARCNTFHRISRCYFLLDFYPTKGDARPGHPLGLLMFPPREHPAVEWNGCPTSRGIGLRWDIFHHSGSDGLKPTLKAVTRTGPSVRTLSALAASPSPYYNGMIDVFGLLADADTEGRLRRYFSNRRMSLFTPGAALLLFAYFLAP